MEIATPSSYLMATATKEPFQSMEANIMTKTWMKAALVRALKTWCQTAAATLGTNALLSEVDWLVVASAATMAAIFSILTSLAGLPEVEA